MRHVFHGQAFRRRPRRAGRGFRPALKIGQIGRQRPQGFFAHALAGEVLQRCEVVVGEEFGASIAPLHWQ